MRKSVCVCVHHHLRLMSAHSPGCDPCRRKQLQELRRIAAVMLYVGVFMVVSLVDCQKCIALWLLCDDNNIWKFLLKKNPL